MNDLITVREQKIAAYATKARFFKIPELPESITCLKSGSLAFLVQNNSAQIYVYYNNLWRKKMEYPLSCFKSACVQGDSLLIECEKYTEEIRFASDPEEKEEYFVIDVHWRNDGEKDMNLDSLRRTAYFPEGPVSDFTYVSFKWMGRKQNLDAYPYVKDNSDYLSVPAHNQLFFNASGPIYEGIAFADVTLDWKSDLERDDVWLHHKFFLRTPLVLKPGEKKTLRFYLFAGVGNEIHAGHLFNVLWRLNPDPIHIPQTDMNDFMEKYILTWDRSALTGKVRGDHFSAHYFSDFFGQFKNGYRPDDQFGCSWLEYDMLKAVEYSRRYKLTGDVQYREKCRNILNFYLYDHYAGSTSLTYPFHTGDFMRGVLPFCENSGWGAPFEADALDSLALPEMIYDALCIYEHDESVFQNCYPFVILEDVLKLQQPDGHFRRLYNSDLTPKEKIGWISQYSETQTWIPVLLKIFKITKDERALAACLRTGERCALDIEEQKLFSMGGCETDYPDYWDVDGFRTMLWAFLELHDFTRDLKWLDLAEKTVLLSSCFQMGYNVPNLPGSFYEQIRWKSRGMVSTSFYPHPDYCRTECTATGNQSVVWVGYLLMRLYRATGKKIYAERGIAAFRQVMVYRDEASLEGNPHKEALLHTIFENNPQMNDEAGLYRKSIPQNSYSAFIDLYLYLGEIIREFGGIYIDTERKHAFGLDCVEVLSSDFRKGTVRLKNQLHRKHETTVFLNGKFFSSVKFEADETRNLIIRGEK